MKQTILGAGGSIGVELAKVLPEFGNDIRLVNRHPKAINPTDELVAADLTKKEDVFRAIKGSDIVYVTVGFPYKIDVWRKHWVPFIENTIAACEENKAKLVFFDNVYMYHPDEVPNMTELSKVDPQTEKGKVRMEVAQRILNAHDDGRIEAVIARAADFYGVGIQRNSMLTELMLNKIAQGKSPQWLGKTNVPHAFTFVPDAAKGMALIGNKKEAYGRAWHLPTPKDPPTAIEWAKMASEMMGQPYKKPNAIPKFGLKLVGLFDPLVRELPEMTYQYDRPYHFNSEAFEDLFDFHPTPYEKALSAIVESDYKS